MRVFAISAAVLLAASASAPAQEAARFLSRVGGGSITGTESYTITRAGSGHEVSAEIAMKRGGAESTFTMRESLDAAWSPLKYSIEMTGSLGSASATVERKGDTFSLAVKTPAGSPTLKLPAPPRTALMENMVAAHYQVLLEMTRGEPGSITVVVPFQLLTIGGTLQAAGAVPGTRDGRPVTAARLLLLVANVTTEIDFDPADRTLLRVYTPGQDAELVREGFTLSPGAAPKGPERPAGVTERTVTFKQIDGQPYQAVLCVPGGASPAPVVVMLAGSGPNDRDETIGPNKPFRDLAWGLAERGVATLRFDKRTYAFPKAYRNSLESESIEDGVDAVAFAKTLPEVDRGRVFVLGHSLGGLAAIYVAERAEVAGLVLMATPGRPMDQVIRDQVRLVNAGQDPATLQRTLELQDSIMAKVRAGTATAKDLNGQPPEAIRDMIQRDPAVELRKTSVPVLVLKGEKDAQVFQPDFDALSAVIAGRPGSSAKLFPNLTHIFTPTDGPATVRAIFQPGHVAPEVLDTIAAWVSGGRR